VRARFCAAARVQRGAHAAHSACGRRRRRDACAHACTPCAAARRAGIVLTNDGNAILREIDVSHPAAKARRAQRARACCVVRFTACPCVRESTDRRAAHAAAPQRSAARGAHPG
jgi:hypothetical protein